MYPIKANQLFFDFKHNESYTVNDMIVGAFNKDVVKVLFSDISQQNPVIIVYGNEGVGKTYLCNIYAKNNNGCSITTNELKSYHHVISLLQKYNVLFLDNLTILSDDEEEGLFHIYNAVVNTGKQLIITSSLPPADFNIKLQDLQSRLKSSLSLKIQDLDDVSLNIIFFKLLTDKQLIISKDAINYIIKRIPRDAKNIHEIVLKLERGAMQTKKTLTIFTIKEILGFDS